MIVPDALPKAYLSVCVYAEVLRLIVITISVPITPDVAETVDFGAESVIVHVLVPTSVFPE